MYQMGRGLSTGFSLSEEKRKENPPVSVALEREMGLFVQIVYAMEFCLQSPVL